MSTQSPRATPLPSAGWLCTQDLVQEIVAAERALPDIEPAATLALRLRCLLSFLQTGRGLPALHSTRLRGPETLQ